MPYITDNMIEEVRSRFDIVEVISSYIDLKKTGKNYVGLCPFHAEKSPSFTVSPEKQIYHCFGCQSGGNIFSFIMQIENMTFPEAVRLLGRKAGLEVDPQPATPQEKKEAKIRELLFQINLTAQEYFQAVLWEHIEGKEALDYLFKRGLTKASIKEFGLGFALDKWDGLTGELRSRDLDLDIALKGGLLGKKTPGRYYDYFRGRIMFPIQDSQGRVAGFGGRSLGDSEPKYLNSPETPVFNKRKILYGFYQALSQIRREKEVVLVEGYMDVILLNQAGIKNTVAPLGTSLTADQVSFLRGRVEKINLVFDADAGGQKAALRSLDLLRKEGCTLQVAELPSGMDPADYIVEKGDSAFREQILKRARSVVDYQLHTIKKGMDLLKEEGRVAYWKEARKILAQIEEILEREEYLKKIDAEINVSLEVLRGDLEKNIETGYRKEKKAFSRKKENNSISPREQLEKELLSSILQYPHYGEEVWGHIGPDDFTSETYREVAECAYQIHREGKELETAVLLSFFPDPQMHKAIMDLALPSFQEGEDKVLKTIRSCLKKIKVLHWSEERKNLIKSIQKGAAKDDVGAALERIQVLKKWEEELYRSGEGEDLNG